MQYTYLMHNFFLYITNIQVCLANFMEFGPGHKGCIFIKVLQTQSYKSSLKVYNTMQAFQVDF